MISIEPNTRQFEPGATITARVQWSDLRDNDRLVVRLFWFTTGKGDRDIEIVSEVPLQATGTSGQEVVKLTAPAWPFSYSGKMVSIQWAIEVVRLPGEDAQTVELVIAPDGRARSPYEMTTGVQST
jgi:hypothetical protein